MDHARKLYLKTDRPVVAVVDMNFTGAASATSLPFLRARPALGTVPRSG